MKAAVITRSGGPEVFDFRDLPDPRPGTGEILLRLEACGVNRVDLDLRSGATRVPLRFPHTLGREPAGTVVEVGCGVASPCPGDPVVVLPVWPCGRCQRCMQGADNLCPAGRQPGISAPGGYAELLVAPALHVLKLPDEVRTEEAAAFLISFGTAWRLLVTLAGVQPGETVLVPGAGGGLGGAAVQVAALRGAKVIAAASSAQKLAGLRELGASALVDYGSTPLAEAVRDLTGGEGVDVAVEQAGGELFSEVVGALRPRGRLVVAGAHGGRRVQLDLAVLYLNEWRLLGSRSQRREELAAVFALLAEGRLRPRIAATLPLAEAGEAHRLLESRAFAGKLVLKP